MQDSLYYQLHTIPTKPCERKGTVAAWRRSDPVIYFSSLLRRCSQCAGICVRLDHPCWISPQMFFALERRMERNGNYFAVQQIDVAQLLLSFTFSCFLNSWTAGKEKKKQWELRGSAAIPIFLPVEMFFFLFNSVSHLLTLWGTCLGSLFLTLTFTSISFIITAHSLPPLPGTFKTGKSTWMDLAFSLSSSCAGEKENKVRISKQTIGEWRVKWHICSQGNLLILCGDQLNVVRLHQDYTVSVFDQLPCMD